MNLQSSKYLNKTNQHDSIIRNAFKGQSDRGICKMCQQRDVPSQHSLQFNMVQSHEKKKQPQRPWLWQSSWQSYWQSFITSKALIMALAKTSASSLLLKFRPYTCLLSRHCKYRIMYYKYIFWHIENTLACCLTTANTLMMNCLNINWNIENK